MYERVKRFQSGRTTVIDEDRSGHPTTSRTADNVERVDALLQEDRRITVADIANKLDISYGFAYSIIYEDLGYHKLCARLVQKRFTDEHKRTRVETCIQFFQRYREEGEAVLQRTVTGGEIWVQENVKPWGRNTCHSPGPRKSKVCLLLAK
jgi:transposase